MKQGVKTEKKNEVKTSISKNFVGAIEEMSLEGIVKNTPELAEKLKKDRSNFHKLGKDQGRYVTIDAIYEAVNGLGLNANFIFVENGPAKEKLLRDSVVTNNNNVSGNKNKVSNITPVFQATVSGNVSIAEKIVQGMPPKERKEMKKYMDNVANEILDLKKTVDHYKKQLRDKEKELKEKDKRLMDTQDKLIQVIMEKKEK